MVVWTEQLILRWQTCVEPHLTYCSEVTFDSYKSTIKAIAQIQTDYFRSCLGLHMRSVNDVMFTDIAILPIKERLLYLSAKFYNYVIANPTHCVHFALRDSITLAQSAKHGWYGSCSSAMEQYGLTVPPDLTPLNLKDMKTRLEASVLADIQQHAATCLAWRYTNPFR